jgi:hypothetical protein
MEGVADRSHRIGRKAALGQTLLEQGHKLCVVFDQKHSHLWSVSSAPSAVPRVVNHTTLAVRRVRLT